LHYALQSTDIIRIKCRSKLFENILMCLDSLHPLVAALTVELVTKI